MKCLTQMAGCCIMLIRKCPCIFGQLQCVLGSKNDCAEWFRMCKSRLSVLAWLHTESFHSYVCYSKQCFFSFGPDSCKAFQRHTVKESFFMLILIFIANLLKSISLGSLWILVSFRWCVWCWPFWQMPFLPPKNRGNGHTKTIEALCCCSLSLWLGACHCSSFSCLFTSL